MKIGVPKEIKSYEYRVAVVPSGVYELVRDGHSVFVQRQAGEGSGIDDEDYAKAGATLVDTIEEVYSNASLIVKVKEPLEEEYKLIKQHHIVFTFLHYAASATLTKAMVESGATTIAYETIERKDGSLPILIPMSEVAGKMSIQEGAKFLEKPMEGRGILLGGVPGVKPANVVIIGGGIVGSNAARVAAGLGARVYILDINVDRLRYLAEIMPPNVSTIYSNAYSVREMLEIADLVIAGVLIPGAKTPKLIKRDDLKRMKKGAVFVDVSIDQGGLAETSRPTTHAEPTYIVDGVVHYCVANIPGAVGRTSTYALTNVTTPYVRRLAGEGWRAAAKKDPAIKLGINTTEGKITHQRVAEAHNLKYTPLNLD